MDTDEQKRGEIERFREQQRELASYMLPDNTSIVTLGESMRRSRSFLASWQEQYRDAVESMREQGVTWR